MERTPAQLREHYAIEKVLAERLRTARREERPGLYGPVYEELYRRVTSLPYHARKRSPEETQASVFERMKIVRPFLKPDAVFLELGAGDCSLSLEVALHVRRAIAVEVSDTMVPGVLPPPGFELLRADAMSLETQRDSIDIVYSNDFIEHLHPEDAPEQLRRAYAMLKPGGVCMCLTPNRASGPWDISRYFDKTATCLHLREYTVRELDALFGEAGFVNTRLLLEIEGRILKIPLWPAVLGEKLMAALPRPLVHWLGARFPFRNLLGVNLVGVK